MFIQTEATPNPATLKFLPGRGGGGGGAAAVFPDRQAAARSPLAAALFEIDGVARIFFGSDFLSVTKAGGGGGHSKPPILGAIMEHFTRELPLLEGAASEEPEAEETYSEEDAEGVGRVKGLLDPRGRPAVANDGGDIIFRGFDGKPGIVSLYMRGSCAGCPSS